jgi:hypothetical protein
MKLLAEGFEACFEELEDPRIDRKKLYPLHEILFVALCGALSGAHSWRELVVFAHTKLPMFKEHFSRQPRRWLRAIGYSHGECVCG